jgi:hypothetical protein
MNSLAPSFTIWNVPHPGLNFEEENACENLVSVGCYGDFCEEDDLKFGTQNSISIEKQWIFAICINLESLQGTQLSL